MRVIVVDKSSRHRTAEAVRPHGARLGTWLAIHLLKWLYGVPHPVVGQDRQRDGRDVYLKSVG